MDEGVLLGVQAEELKLGDREARAHGIVPSYPDDRVITLATANPHYLDDTETRVLDLGAQGFLSEPGA